MDKLHVGLSTYADPAWKGEGKLYPPKTPTKQFLTLYAARYHALEADGTFYRIPTAETVAKWIGETPSGFRISPKMSQLVTHFARLKSGGFEALHSFIEALKPVEEAGKLGPILVQLPPNLKRDDALLSGFMAEIAERETLHWAFEFRHESWKATEVEAMLQARNMAWVLAETAEAAPPYRDTSEQVYVRLRKLQYSDEELDAWAKRLETWVGEGKECFVYCRHKDVEAPWRWADRILRSAASESRE